MGKRYGRNQKRRAAGEILKLESELRWSKKNLYDAQQAKASTIGMFNELVVKIEKVCPNSILLSPKTRECDCLQDELHVDKQSEFQEITSMAYSQNEPIKIDTMKLHHLDFKLKQVQGFETMCHLYLKNKHEIRYYISDRAFLKAAHDRPALRNMIFEQFEIYLNKGRG